MSRKEFLFGMTGACGICGGIASANLNVLQALVELAREMDAGLTVFSLLETQADRPHFLPQWVRFKAFRGNKALFIASLIRAGMGRPICFFDHVRLGLPLLPLAAVGAIKTVIFVHGRESWECVRNMSQWLFQSASLCIANSHFTLRKMRERISKFNGAVCLLGLPPSFPLHEEVPPVPAGAIELEAADGRRRALKDRVLLLAARMYSREGLKGHRALIDVLPELLKEFQDVQLVFPGPGDDRKNLEAWAERKGVAASVFLPGLVSTETLRSLYNRSYAFVMPSKQEGFGLAYLEAMNYGKPCVGCFDQGAGEIIVHGETGFLIDDPTNSKELLEVLLALLRDPERGRDLGRKGFERLHQYFTSHHHQHRVKGQIEKIVQ